MTQVLQNKGVQNAIFAPVGLDISAIPNIASDKIQLKQALGIPQQKKSLYVSVPYGPINIHLIFSN